MLAKTTCLSVIFFAIAVYMQRTWIHWMRGIGIGEAIKDYGPAEHKKKKGTPGMGGIVAFVLAPVAALAINFCGATRAELLLIWSYPLMAGSVGLADDVLKSFRKSSEGLRSLQKLTLQIIVCCVWTFIVAKHGIYLTPEFRLPLVFGAPILVFFTRTATPGRVPCSSDICPDRVACPVCWNALPETIPAKRVVVTKQLINNNLKQFFIFFLI